MRRLLTLSIVAAAALVVFAQGGSTVLGEYAKKLSDAKSLSVTYVVQRVGGAPSEYNLQLAKPNMIRFDKPDELIVGDGTTLTVYSKSAKTYYKQPQNADAVKSILSADEARLWAAFFDGNAFANTSAKALGKQNRKGQSYDAVQVALDKTGKKTMTYLFDGDKLAKVGIIDLNDPQGKQTFIIDAKDLSLFGVAADLGDAFAFKPPAGSREISASELNSARWYTDLEEAKKVAAATNRKIFVDFMATWCGPCKMLEHDVLSTEEFKKMSKYVVFLQIDVDAQPSVAKMYGIEAMPTQMVLAADGSVISKTVGYGGAQAFYNWFNGAIK
jgi:thiol-disulfide isomerase/thioredoxin